MREIEELFETSPVSMWTATDCPGYGYSAVDDPRNLPDPRRHPEKFKDFERLARSIRCIRRPCSGIPEGRALSCPALAWGQTDLNVKGGKVRGS